MIRAALVFLSLASAAQALDLAIPNASPTKVSTQLAGSLRLPTEPWTPGSDTPVIDGAIRRTVLRNETNTLTTLQLLAPLRESLRTKGYREVFTCADAICGGFDFRFQLDLLGEPDMHVDLGNYRYALFTQPGANPHTVALVASPSSTQGFIHVTEVSDALFPIPDPTPDLPDPEPTSAGELADQLLMSGRAVLDDLEFGTGSADLGLGPFASLADLSAWLGNNPTARIVLVGHTDAVGSLEANTSLSRRRAAAVADRLVKTLATNPVQLQAAGTGYLAPRASNLTTEGRSANRRVEVVLLSLE